MTMIGWKAKKSKWKIPPGTNLLSHVGLQRVCLDNSNTACPANEVAECPIQPVCPQRACAPQGRCVWRTKGAEQRGSQLQSLTWLHDGLIHSTLDYIILKIKSRERRWKIQESGGLLERLAGLFVFLLHFCSLKGRASFPIFSQLYWVLLPPNSPTLSAPSQALPPHTPSKCPKEAGMMDNRCSLTYCVIYHTTAPIPLQGLHICHCRLLSSPNASEEMV